MTRENSFLKGAMRLFALLVGPREGDNDFLEFPSVEDAIAYGRVLYGERRFQLEGIEDASGRSLMAYDELHYRCRPPRREAQRSYG